MSIASLTNTQTYAENRRPSSKPGESPCSSFQARLEHAASGAASNQHNLCMGDTVAYSGGHVGQNGRMQEFCAHYTEDSTPKDPVVRITGVGDSGSFDFLCRINDVDPANASYVELAALLGHLTKTGEYQGNFSGPLPHTMEFRGDVTVKHNFIAEIQDSLSRPSCIIPTADSVLGAKDLLALYQNYTSGDSPLSSRSASALDHSSFMKDNLLSSLADFRSGLLDRMKLEKEKKEEQDAWDKLMEYLDAWIESLREEADVQKLARAHAALTALQADAELERENLDDVLLKQLETLLA